MKISVVLPTYNTPVPFLREAVESILNQTFKDFEFIIIDDGSTDESRDYLAGLTDPRIRILRNEKNIGVTKSLNIGLQAAQGKYIARMDGDDISLPERFEKQYAFMESHPDVIACGTVSDIMGETPPELPTEMEDMDSYRVRMLFINPGPSHPTAFYNHEMLTRYSIRYDENLIYAQDYGMWMTLSQYGRICILPEILVHRRMHQSQISSAHREKQIACDKMTQKKLLTQLLGDVTEEELSLHYDSSTFYHHDAILTPQLNEWYRRLTEANRIKGIYNQKALEWKIICIKNKLIYQTLTTDMSKKEKIMLFFRYLPFSIAVKNVIQMMKSKLQKRRNG